MPAQALLVCALSRSTDGIWSAALQRAGKCPVLAATVTAGAAGAATAAIAASAPRKGPERSQALQRRGPFLGPHVPSSSAAPTVTASTGVTSSREPEASVAADDATASSEPRSRPRAAPSAEGLTLASPFLVAPCEDERQPARPSAAASHPWHQFLSLRLSPDDRHIAGRLTAAAIAAAAAFGSAATALGGCVPQIGPLQLSFFWGVRRVPARLSRPQLAKVGGGGVDGQALDWLDRTLLRFGAARYGVQVPTSLTDRIVALNCVVFLADMLCRRRLTVLGAKVNELIVFRHQWWRLLTPALLHGGPLHLAMNCAALRNVGPPVEVLLGPKRFLGLYVASALAGAVLSTMLSPAPAVGASGAVFGLMGAFATFLFEKRSVLLAHGKGDYFPVLARTVALNLLAGAADNHIDNWGHVGGLLAGCVLMHQFMSSSATKKRGL